MHSKPGDIGNCDICTKNMVSWQEHHSGVGGKVQFNFLYVLGQNGAVGRIMRTG